MNDAAVLAFFELELAHLHTHPESDDYRYRYLGDRAACLLQEIAARRGGRLGRHLTVEGLLAYTASPYAHTKPMASNTLTWLRLRGRNAVGPARCTPEEWRAFYRRHPDVMRTSWDAHVRGLADRFKAQDDAAEARAAMDKVAP